MLKFDLSEIVPGSIKSASLQLTAAADISGTRNFTVYGLEHDTAGSDWDEASIQFSGAPGLVFDGNSRTLGVNDLFHDARANTYGDPANLMRLGAINLSGTTSAGSLVALTSPNLAVFLNIAAHFESATQDGIVTLVLQENKNASVASFYAKEGIPDFAPQLLVDAVLAPVTILPGDYNVNGAVDAADYVLWRKNNNTAVTLPNDATPGTSPADYTVWRTHFGEMVGTGSGATTNTNVPEPKTLVLLMFAAAGPYLRRRRAA